MQQVIFCHMLLSLLIHWARNHARIIGVDYILCVTRSSLKSRFSLLLLAHYYIYHKLRFSNTHSDIWTICTLFCLSLFHIFYRIWIYDNTFHLFHGCRDMWLTIFFVFIFFNKNVLCTGIFFPALSWNDKTFIYNWM